MQKVNFENFSRNHENNEFRLAESLFSAVFPVIYSRVIPNRAFSTQKYLLQQKCNTYRVSIESEVF